MRQTDRLLGIIYDNLKVKKHNNHILINPVEIEIILLLLNSKAKIPAKEIIRVTGKSRATIYSHLKSLEKDKIVKHMKQLGNYGSPPKQYYSRINQIQITINCDGITAYYQNSSLSGKLMRFRGFRYVENMR